MPLDWAEVKRRYEQGALIPTAAGGQRFNVIGADDGCIRIRSPLWEDSLERSDLEKAVMLIEEGKLTRHPGKFAEEYRLLVADCRPTSAAHILKDLGFLA